MGMHGEILLKSLLILHTRNPAIVTGQIIHGTLNAKIISNLLVILINVSV